MKSGDYVVLAYRFNSYPESDCLFRIVGFSNAPIDSVIVVRENDKNEWPTRQVRYFSKHHLVKVKNIKLAKLLFE